MTGSSVPVAAASVAAPGFAGARKRFWSSDPDGTGHVVAWASGPYCWVVAAEGLKDAAETPSGR